MNYVFFTDGDRAVVKARNDYTCHFSLLSANVREPYWKHWYFFTRWLYLKGLYMFDDWNPVFGPILCIVAYIVTINLTPCKNSLQNVFFFYLFF